MLSSVEKKKRKDRYKKKAGAKKNKIKSQEEKKMSQEKCLDVTMKGIIVSPTRYDDRVTAHKQIQTEKKRLEKNKINEQKQ